MRRFMPLLLLALLMLPAQTVGAAQPPRRVNIPYQAASVNWAQSAIFWLGQAQDTLPGRNYADVRLVYTADSLQVLVTVIDYYLWTNQNPQPADDLTQYDAVALYLDTGFDRAASPQTDDYMFLSALRTSPIGNAPQYHRQAKGTGSAWNTAWAGSWSDTVGLQWSCGGPNDNSCNIDYGWASTFTIPWSTLGRSGPPPAGELWGLGLALYDRDANPPAGAVAPQFWPETFAAAAPSTWAELHFGYADYQPPAAITEGTTIIRAASPTDNTVADAWMGGGGGCSSGHNGGTEINHGDDTSLYVGTETAPTHFPCFNKSYLRFALASLPPGKAIISATLTLHEWGNAGDPGLAQPSWVHLFSIADSWDEMTIHWNNAPLAHENISASWVNPFTGALVWPGQSYSWDATQAVAQAYAAGQPANLAIYGSDTEQHSSKYLTASETGDWNVAGRPKLTVVWGQAVATVSNEVSPAAASVGETATYTLALLGSGETLTLTDQLPAQVSAPGPITVSGGPAASYNAGQHRVTWTGAPAIGQLVTISFSVTVLASGPLAADSIAVLTDSQSRSSSDTATLLVDPRQTWLPVVIK